MNLSKFTNIISNDLAIEESFIKKEASNDFLKIIINYLKIKEFSIIENIPIGTVKSRLYSARSELKKLINSKPSN